MPDEKTRENDEERDHEPGEQYQPGKGPEQPADEVDLDQKDPKAEGRTNVDAHTPRDDEAEPRQGQSLRPRERDANGDDDEDEHKD